MCYFNWINCSRVVVFFTIMVILASCGSDIYREPVGLTPSTGATLITTIVPYETAPGGEVKILISMIDGKFNDIDSLGLVDGTVLISPGQHVVSVIARAHSFMSSRYSGSMVTSVTVAAGKKYHFQVGNITASKNNGFVVSTWIADAEGVPACEPFEVNVVLFGGGSAAVPIILPAIK